MSSGYIPALSTGRYIYKCNNFKATQKLFICDLVMLPIGVKSDSSLIRLFWLVFVMECRED